MARRQVRPSFDVGAPTDSPFAVGGASDETPFATGGAAESPFSVSGMSPEVEARQRQAAAESALAQTEKEAYEERRAEADEEIAVGVWGDTTIGSNTGLAAGGWVGALIGLILSAATSGVAQEAQHGKKKVRQDVEEAVAASGAEVTAEEAKAETLAAEQLAQAQPTGTASAIMGMRPLMAKAEPVPLPSRRRVPKFTV